MAQRYTPLIIKTNFKLRIFRSFLFIKIIAFIDIHQRNLSLRLTTFAPVNNKQAINFYSNEKNILIGSFG